MKTHNAYGKMWYIYLHIVCAAICWEIYSRTLFVCIFGTTGKSLVFLGVLVLFSITSGISLTWTNRRNTLNIAVSVLLPFEVYTMIAFRDVYPVSVGLVLIVVLLLVARFCFAVMRRPVRSMGDQKRIKRRRLHYCTIGSRTIATGCMFIFCGVLFARASISGYLIKSSVEPVVGNVEGNECTISNNIDTVSLLAEDKWAELSIHDRLAVLQTVANIEARYLGLPHELTVSIASMEDNTVGEYDEKTHEIYISMNELEEADSRNSLDTICHEAYHSYQRELVKLYDGASDEERQLLFFRQLKQYEYEFENYVSGEDAEYIDYYFQDVERDARSYASTAARDYYDNIGEYLCE